MSVIETSTRRPVTVFMFTLALLVFGMVLLNKLGVSLLPDLSYPTLTIRTEYEGAAPIEVENLITKPIEETVEIGKTKLLETTEDIESEQTSTDDAPDATQYDVPLARAGAVA